MEKQTFRLSFEGVGEDDANKYAQELEGNLSNKSAEAEVSRGKPEPGNQDFGATLIIAILGTKAVEILAEKIGDWLKNKSAAKVTIKTATGEMVVENISSGNADELADKWLSKL